MDDKKPIKQTPVHVFAATDKSSSVEWVDRKGVHRGLIPAGKVVNGKVDQDTLDAAIPYGIPWAEFPLPKVTGEDLQAAMYAAGMWTPEDVMRQPQKVIGALQYLYQVHLGSLVEFAAKYK